MIGVIIVAAAVAAAQLYQSEKARGASAATLKKLKADFDRLVPPEYNLSPMDHPDYIKKAIPEPRFDVGEITPEQFKLVGKYTPEIAGYVAEQRPELVKQTAGMQEGRDAQLGALHKLKEISTQASDPELAQAQAQAAKQAQIQAQSRQQSVLQDMARRGMLGSGAGLAGQLQGGSDAMERQAMQGQAAAAEQYRNRLQALRDSATLGGQVFQQDEAIQGKNADIINAFNQRTAANRQGWEGQRAGTLNDAQRLNLGAAQHVADLNTEQGNKARFGERDRRDDLQKYLRDIREREQTRQNDLIGKEADWDRQERDRQDRLQGQHFGEEMQFAAGKNGLGVQGINMLNQATGDRNQAIQGLGNATIGGIQAVDDRQAREDEQKRRAKERQEDPYGYYRS